MKRGGIIVCLLFLFLLIPALTASAAPKVVVDGRVLNSVAVPRVENGTTLVPMRGIFEALGALVDWDADTGTITAVKGQTRIVLKTGSYSAYRNGREIRLTAPARVVNGATLVPLRFVGESLGADVYWHSATQTAYVSSGPGLVEQPAPVFDSADVVRRDFRWKYGGRIHTCTLALPEQACRYYAGLERVPTNDLSVYVTDPYDDEFVAAVADQLQKMADAAGYSARQRLEFVIAFVQSLEYITDDVSKGLEQYPQYPLETLNERQGDCEDTSILLAAVLEQMGYGVVLLLIEGEPGHMAVGVKGEGLPGVYYEAGGSRYHYVETTGTDWRIGDIPQEYRGLPVQILPLVPQPVILHQWWYTVANGHMELRVAVNNHGTGTAGNTRVYAAFDAGGGMVYNQCWSDPLDLKPRSRGTYVLHLDVPSGVPTRLIVRIVSNGTVLDESRSEWFRT